MKTWSFDLGGLL